MAQEVKLLAMKAPRIHFKKPDGVAQSYNPSTCTENLTRKLKGQLAWSIPHSNRNYKRGHWKKVEWGQTPESYPLTTTLRPDRVYNHQNKLEEGVGGEYDQIHCIYVWNSQELIKRIESKALSYYTQAASLWTVWRRKQPEYLWSDEQQSDKHSGISLRLKEILIQATMWMNLSKNTKHSHIDTHMHTYIYAHICIHIYTCTRHTQAHTYVHTQCMNTWRSFHCGHIHMIESTIIRSWREGWGSYIIGPQHQMGKIKIS